MSRQKGLEEEFFRRPKTAVTCQTTVAVKFRPLSGPALPDTKRVGHLRSFIKSRQSTARNISRESQTLSAKRYVTDSLKPPGIDGAARTPRRKSSFCSGLDDVIFRKAKRRKLVRILFYLKHNLYFLYKEEKKHINVTDNHTYCNQQTSEILQLEGRCYYYY